MDKQLLKNYIYNISYQLVKIVFPLITVPFLYSHIGAATLGISDFASNIAAWFILFGILGVNTYGNREIAKIRDDKDKLSKTFFEIFAMQAINMLIATVFYFIYVFITVSKNLDIYILTGLILLASMFDITWFFYGVEDFKKASIRNIIVKVIGVGLILLVIRKPEDLWLYVLINSGSELIGQAIMFFQLKQYIDFKKINLVEAYRNHFKNTFVLFLPTIAISIYTLLDQTMLGYLYNTLHLNYYKTSMSIIKMFLYFITSIGSVMLPRVTNVYYNDGDGQKKAQEMIKQTMKIALLFAIPMCFGMMGIANRFISWYLPSDPEIASLIILGCPIIIFISMSNVTGIQYMVPTGMYKQYTQSVVLGAIVNFFINLLLIPRFGAYGAIIGSLIAEFTVTLVQVIVIKKETGLWLFSLNEIKYFIAAFLMTIVVYFSGEWFSILLVGFPFKPDFVCNLMQVLFGVITYFLVLIITREELVTKILNKVKNHAQA